MGNRAVVRKGIERARKAIEAYLLQLCKTYAIRALQGALRAYDESADGHNLTGNTRTGFTAAVYLDGQLIYGPLNVLDNEAGISVEPPTSGFTTVGRGGFKKYGSNYAVPMVLPYSDPNLRFVGTMVGAYASEKTRQFIERHRPKQKRGITVVVANCSTYVNFLESERDFDILASESDKTFIRKRFDEVIRSLDFEKIFKKTGK